MRGMYLDIVDPVIRAHYVDTIIRAKVSASNCQVVNLKVDSKVEDDMEFGAVNQNEIMNCSVNGRDQADQSGTESARSR